MLAQIAVIGLSVRPNIHTHVPRMAVSRTRARETRGYMCAITHAACRAFVPSGLQAFFGPAGLPWHLPHVQPVFLPFLP